MVRVPPPLPKWQAPIWPFTLHTWIAIVVAFVVIGPILYCMAASSALSVGSAPYLESLTSSYLLTTGIHLREPLEHEPTTNSGRILLASLLLYSLVLEVSYNTNLTAFLTVTRQPRSIETYKDLYDSGLPIVSLWLTYKDLLKASSISYYHEMHKRFVLLPGEEESVQSVLDGRAAYLLSQHYDKYIVARVNSEYGRQIVELTKECAWPHNVAVGLQSNTPLKPVVDRVTNWVVEGGLVSKWLNDGLQIATRENRMKRKQTIEEKETSSGNDAIQVLALNVEHVQGVFYMIGFPYLSAVITFIIELILGRKQQNNTTE